MARKKTNKSDLDEELEIIKKERNDILNFKLNVKCKTKKQKELLKTILEKEVTLVDAYAGVGKSLISIFAALTLLKDHTNGYDKIIMIYPTELSKEENLGALPGELLQGKLAPYIEADNATMEKIFLMSGRTDGKEIIQKLVESGKLEYRPAAYLRGFTFDSSIVILNECQNFTKDTFLKVLTRIGHNSKYIIIGDSFQVDSNSIKSGKKMMGLQYAMEKLADLPEFGVVEFGLEDVLRNDIIVKILKRWNPEIYGNLDEEEEFKKAQEERIDDE